MEAKILAYVLIGIFLGPIFSLAVTPIFCLLRKIFFVPFIRKNLREKAEKKGHIIEAELQKSYNIRNHDTDFGPTATMKDMGIYSYRYNGKKYKYRMVTTTRLPEKITLYYINNPGKATIAKELGNRETKWLKFYLIISILIAFMTVVIGMVIG